MKHCPTCSRVYADDALRFCRHDGAPLAAAAEDATRLLDPEAAADDAAPSRAGTGGGGRGSSPVTSSSLTVPLARRRAPRKVIDSLAVLPFTNESADSNAEYLCDGITENVINVLSQLPRLRVLPRSTAFRYKGREIDPQEAGRALGVRAVLTGRVVEVGRLLVIKTELVDVEQESHLWGEQYRRELTDIFALQEEISRDISEKLRLRLSGEDRRKLSKRYTENTEAYHAYLRGRYYVTSKRTEDWIRRGIESFQRAIDLDPNYALAYSGLADAYAFLASSTGERAPRDAYPKAKAAALRALELDDALAEARASLGFSLLLYDWDFGGAEREFNRALKLNPNYANTHDGLGFYYKATGQHDKAVRECKESRRLDPLSPFPKSASAGPTTSRATTSAPFGRGARLWRSSRASPSPTGSSARRARKGGGRLRPWRRSSWPPNRRAAGSPSARTSATPTPSRAATRKRAACSPSWKNSRPRSTSRLTTSRSSASASASTSRPSTCSNAPATSAQASSPSCASSRSSTRSATSRASGNSCGASER